MANPKPTTKDYFYHISRLGAFSLVHIMRRKPSASDPKISICETIRSFKTPTLTSEDEAQKAIDNAEKGKLECLPSSMTAFPIAVS